MAARAQFALHNDGFLPYLVASGLNFPACIDDRHMTAVGDAK
jgi:hypothetical protein